MIRPIWNTLAGTLGTFSQGTDININLSASNTSLIEVISGELPRGLRLDGENQTISGIPADIGITKNYEFVLRASNNTGVNNAKIIQDRTFNLTIDSNVVPVLLDPEGTLKVGLSNENYILNFSTVNYQFTASATSIPAGQKLKFYVEEGEGELPPGLKLSEDGILYGTIKDDLDLDFKVVQGTYDKDYYDVNPYDYGDNIEPATARTLITSGRVTGTSITYGGNGYLLDPEVIIGGSVETVTIVDGGTGYTVAPRVVFSNSPISGGITAQGIATISNGSVVSITVTNPGTGYSTPPKIYFQNQNTGSGATATCSLFPGFGADITARVSNGTLVELVVNNSGSGYTQAPLISFGLPTAGSRIISKTYKFKVTVANGENIDTKTYSILVKSEDSLRVDTTFISSDTFEFDTSRTYVQPPIWISNSLLPTIKGNNNFTYDLVVFDPTPNVGRIYFTLLDTNFDGTDSQLGPSNIVKNQESYAITAVGLSRPATITLDKSSVFVDGDRVKLTSMGNLTELEGNSYFVKKVDDFQYELYSDKILINPVNAARLFPYTGGGKASPNVFYLDVDPVGGEIFGFIPYQPEVTRAYTFTIKVSRIVEDIEVANAFRQFQITVKGNIDSDISFITPTLVGNLKPNELSLLTINAISSLKSAALNYQVVPGYGIMSDSSFTEIDLTELNGEIYVDGYGLNPFLTFDKGRTYKINLNLENFNVSFRSPDGSYYNNGVKHSTGTSGSLAQEKQNGYFIFNVPYDNVTSVKLTYTNIKKDGLFLSLKKFNNNNLQWERVQVYSYFNEDDAYLNNIDNINSTTEDAFAIIVDYTRVSFVIKKYNKQTLIWEEQDIPTIEPSNPIVDNYWLDLDNSNYGLLEFGFAGIRGVWSIVKPAVVESIPSNSAGVNGDYFTYKVDGRYTIIRKINGVWKTVERLDYRQKQFFDPNVFFTKATSTAPLTNVPKDLWFKYNSLYNGNDKAITVRLKSLDSLPTDLTVSLSGDIIGKISPNTGNTYRSYYTSNTLYLVNDVVTFGDDFYICVNQNRSSGNWFQDINDWSPFFFTKRTITSIDVNSFGVGKFSIAGQRGDDATSIDKLLRFRIRAKDTQNVYFKDKDFNIDYDAVSNTTLTNIYLKPFLNKTSRESFFNFITNPNIFLEDSVYRPEDPNFGVQRIPKMLLFGGIEATTAERYASAVQRNYYDRPLYFGDVKKAIAINSNNVEYEVIYVEINDPYEIGDKSVVDQINLGFDYDPLTTDYTKIRMDNTSIVATETGLDTVYPSSITLMQGELTKVTLSKTESVLIPPQYEDWGRIPQYQDRNNNNIQDSEDLPYVWIDLNPVTEFEDWGGINERVALIEDFLSTIEPLSSDENYRPLWMNTSQDGTGNPIGYVKAVPICYALPGQGDKILERIVKSKFDFKQLNFTIDRIIIQNPQGETGDKYIKFINREII
jgi:hypothetical protein